MKKKISITLNEKTLHDIDTIIDNIYIRNRSQAIELLVSNALGENKVAVILSGGPEEDLRISSSEYRITAKIGELTVIETVLAKLKEDGFTKVYLIARKKILNDVFSIAGNGSKYGVSLDFIEEKESKGTADSLKLIRGKINTNFLVVYGDVLFTSLNLDELWNEHIKRKGVATLLLTTTPDPSKKGVVKIEGSKILEFIQKPNTSDVYLGFSSIFVTQPELLEYLGSSFEDTIFPELAKKGLLNGYLSTSRIIKLHNKKDISRI
ncbi:MAG: sugar phosphate nucleotidyltransferase [archaeon]